MKLVVVGGHSRNIGKTSVMASIIAATPELAWTAVKLTQFGHNLCSADGRPCDCAVDDPLHAFSITREDACGGGSDTSRFLAAGAQEAYWLRAPQGGLAAAMPDLKQLLNGKQHVIMESNSVLRFLRPDLYLVVLDPAVSDFKASARENLDRAAAFLIVHSADSRTSEEAGAALVKQSARGSSAPHLISPSPAAAWDRVPLSLIERRPVFHVNPPCYLPPEALSLIREKLGLAEQSSESILL